MKHYGSDPWNLSPGQREALQACIDHLCEKRAADALGRSAKTISAQRVRAREKMGARNRLEMILMWDRFSRGAA